MSTTPIETWKNVDPETLGVIYPFAGAEYWLILIAVAFWLIWHVLQFRHEKHEIRNDLDVLKENGNLERAVKGDSLLR